MSDPLTTYLQDHLMIALQPVELLKAMGEHHAGEPPGEFATHLRVEIESYRDVLANLTETWVARCEGRKNGARGLL